MVKEYDIIVAGGGIAGLTAGLTAAKSGLNTFMLIGNVLGGNLLSIEKIDGFPGYPDGIAGYELCPITQGDAVQAGAELTTGELLELTPQENGWLIRSETEKMKTKAVVLAMGARLRPLGVVGEEKYIGKGVSHCASCDAPLLRGKIVAVVGGGDSALQEALTLANSVAKVIILQKGDALTAQDYYQNQVSENSKIEILYNVEVDEILGSDTVEAVKIRDHKASTEKIIDVSGVFIYVGLQPNTENLNGLTKLDMSGRILVNEALQTEHPGLLSVGSVRSGSTGRAAGAAEDAIFAIDRAVDFIQNNKWR